MLKPKSKILLCSSIVFATICITKTPNVNANSGVTDSIRESVDVVEEVTDRKVNLTSLGEFKITVYDACVECSDNWGTQLARPCSDGHSARVNHTVAVDPKVIPYGTKLLIDGVEYVAEDCGGAVRGNIIDVYVEDCKNSFGRKYSEVFIKDN